MKQRIEYIDLAKGLCISLVVLFHIDQQIDASYTETHIEKALSYFRMPLYYFLSGIFFKNYSGFLDFTIRKTNKLLIPYAFFFLISYLTGMLCHFLGFYEKGIVLEPFKWNLIFEIFTGGSISYNAPIWFLLSLFEINILFYALHRIINNKKFLLLVSLLIGIIFSYTITLNKLPYFIGYTLKYIPFFAIGFTIKDIIINHNQRLSPKYILIPFSCLTLIYGITYIPIYNSPLVSYIAGAIGIAMIMLTANILTKLPVFSYIGRYSIIVLGFHTFLVRPLKFVFSFLPLKPFFLYLIIFICVIVLMRFLIIPASLKLFPSLTAQKDLIHYKHYTKPR